MSTVAQEDLLRVAELRIEGQLVVASNTTVLCSLADSEHRAVYKPVRGERPLWDFPLGTLAGREVATYELAAALDWDVVPLTVLRDGPLGPGMVQWWIEEDPTTAPMVELLPPAADLTGWRPVLTAMDEHGDPVVLVHAERRDLRQLAVLDVVVNNADRKASHLLSPSRARTDGGEPGTIFGVDHGLTFHAEPKLRTALWGWAGEPLTATEIADLSRLQDMLAGDLGTRLAELVHTDEVQACAARVTTLLREGCLPTPPQDRTPIPWPVF